MKTGAPRKPTKLKILTGTFRKDRANLDEPDVEVGIPPTPKHLTGEARREWERITPQLAACGMLSEIDLPVLAVYCQAWGRWVKAETKIAELDEIPGMDGELMKAPSGYLVRNEWLNIANKAMEHVHKFAVELGLSAQSRSRIHKIRPKETPDKGWKAFGS